MISFLYNTVKNNATSVYTSALNYSLLEAAECGSVTTIERLLKLGADINATNKTGETALHIASKEGWIAAVRYLCEKGANTEAKNKYYEYETFVHAMLGKGEGYDVKEREEKSGNQTPLHYAVKNGCNPYNSAYIVSILCEHGADLNARDDRGETPLQKAEKSNIGHVVNVLQKEIAKREHKRKPENQGGNSKRLRK